MKQIYQTCKMQRNSKIRVLFYTVHMAEKFDLIST